MGVAALGAMGFKAAQAPGLLGKAKAFGGQLSGLRQQAMLSGFALPKSILGGVGASVGSSLEHGSLAPLRELLSGETLRDVGRAFTAGRTVGPVGVNASELPSMLALPGRAIGAFDTAIRNSLVRAELPRLLQSGIPLKKAQEKALKTATQAMLQAPLPRRLAQSLENPTMRHVLPFRRTPFNQLIEGGAAIGEHPAISAGYAGAGAVQGAAESDEQYPVGAGFGVAASGKYGLPNAFGQLVGRYWSGGKGAGSIGTQALPISEYGVSQSLTQPAQPFEKPAFITMLERLGLVTKGRY